MDHKEEEKRDIQPQKDQREVRTDGQHFIFGSRDHSSCDFRGPFDRCGC